MQAPIINPPFSCSFCFVSTYLVRDGGTQLLIVLGAQLRALLHDRDFRLLLVCHLQYAE